MVRTVELLRKWRESVRSRMMRDPTAHAAGFDNARELVAYVRDRLAGFDHEPADWVLARYTAGDFDAAQLDCVIDLVEAFVTYLRFRRQAPVRLSRIRNLAALEDIADRLCN